MTSTMQQEDARAANQNALLEGLAEVRSLLARAAGRESTEAASEVATGGALEEPSSTFGLSSFERRIVVLCAGMELEPSLTALCAEAQGDAARQFPTFGLAPAAFPDAHWPASIACVTASILAVGRDRFRLA